MYDMCVFPERKLVVQVSPVTADQSMFITDLDADCLEYIFNELPAKALLNAAETCKLMQTTATLAIKRMVKNKRVDIKCWTNYGVDLISDDGSVLHINCMKTGLRFLRCFGHVIFKASLTFDPRWSKHNKTTTFYLQYLFKYCTDSLVEIKIDSAYEMCQNFNAMSYKSNCRELDCCDEKNCVAIALKSLWETDRKPFKNIEKIELSYCFFDNELIKLNEIFPKVRSIYFAQQDWRLRIVNKLTNWKCIAEPFDNLQHLSVNIASQKCTGFQEDDVISALILNPKLKSLYLIWRSFKEFEPGFFLKLSEHSVQLESLGFDFSDCLNNDGCHVYKLDERPSPLSKFQGKVIHFKSVKTLYINFGFDPYPFRIPFTFDSLEKFTVKSEYPFDKFIIFLRNNPSVTNIYFQKQRWDGEIIGDNAKHIRMFPKEINHITLSVEEAISIINKCEPIESFHFSLVSHSEYPRFKQLMENKWNISKDKINNVELCFVKCQKKY